MPTNTTIATTSTQTNNETAPSVRSARLSVHGFRRRSSTRCSADRDPLRRDDLLRGGRALDPADERGGGAFRLAFGHLVEARHPGVLAGDDVRLVALHAVQADGVAGAFV